jgi:hypothetical protein
MKPPMRFSRHDGIYRSDVINKTSENWGRGTASRWSAPGPVKGRGGRPAPYSSSTMSSGRLFLDRVARQHGPSPLHRQTHPKTVPGWSTMNLQRTANSVLTVCLSQGDKRISCFSFVSTILLNAPLHRLDQQAALLREINIESPFVVTRPHLRIRSGTKRIPLLET